MIQYKDNLPIDLRKAKANATRLANISGVNHVIVKIGNYYNVYTEKQYPNDFLELVEPEKKEVKSEVIESKPITPIKKNVRKA